MKRHPFANARTLTSRLLLAFSAIAIGVGLFMLVLFNEALHLGEDTVNQRSLLVAKDVAVERYTSGAIGPIRLDPITYAYDNLDDVPEEIPRSILQYKEHIEELHPEQESIYVLVSSFTRADQEVPLILVAHVEQLEMTGWETIQLNLMSLVATLVLMAAMGAIIYFLSLRLIQPVNDLSRQLTQRKDDTETPLTVAESAADEFVQLTDAFNRYHQQLNQLIAREQAFSRYASHELRTPLTIVRGATNLISHSNEPEFIKRQQQRILAATGDMQTMVDALLSLVRYERNEHQLEARSLAEAELTEILDHERAGTNNKDVRLLLECKGTPKVKAEPAVVKMVVGNLLRNAIAATREGEVRLEVYADRLEVLDQGPGLEPSLQESSGGHGLGLLIIDDLCQRYHWRFELGNRNSGGCCARIYFQPNHTDCI